MTAKLSWRETADCLAWELEDARLEMHGMREEITYLRSIIQTYDAQHLYWAQQNVEWQHQLTVHEKENEKEDVPVTPVKKQKKKKKSPFSTTNYQLMEMNIPPASYQPSDAQKKMMMAAKLFMPLSSHHQCPFKMLGLCFKEFLSSPKDVFFTLDPSTTIQKNILMKPIETIDVHEHCKMWKTASMFWFAELGVMKEAVHEVMVSTFVRISGTLCEDADKLDVVIDIFSSEEKTKAFHDSIPADHPYKDLLALWINFSNTEFLGSLEAIVSFFRTHKYLEAQGKLRKILSIPTDISIFTCTDLEKKYRVQGQTYTLHQCIALRWCKAMAAMLKCMEFFVKICITSLDGWLISSQFVHEPVDAISFEYPTVTFCSLFKRQMGFIQLPGAEPFSTITTLEQALSMVETKPSSHPALPIHLHKIDKGSFFQNL